MLVWGEALHPLVACRDIRAALGDAAFTITARGRWRFPALERAKTAKSRGPLLAKAPTRHIEAGCRAAAHRAVQRVSTHFRWGKHSATRSRSLRARAPREALSARERTHGCASWHSNC